MGGERRLAWRGLVERRRRRQGQGALELAGASEAIKDVCTVHCERGAAPGPLGCTPPSDPPGTAEDPGRARNRGAQRLVQAGGCHSCDG